MAADTTLAGLDALDLAPPPARRSAGERARRGWTGLWPKLVAEYPSIGEFQARTTRQIPVVMLTRLG